MSGKTVFISYRRDATGKAFARSLELKLTQRGYDVFLDVDCMDPGEWAKQLHAEVPAREHFLLLLTPGALDRCADADDWVRREFLLAARHRRNIVPIREESVNLATLRTTADASMQPVFDLQIADIRHGSFEADVETLITRYIHSDKAPKANGSNPQSADFDLTRIDRHAPELLVGREAELSRLDEAWRQAPGRPHVLAFVAMGGEGKTSLVAKWAADLVRGGSSGCEAAFAWSFYSQGAGDRSNASADLFLREALRFFGDEAMADSPRPATEKGKRLAALAGGRRALLVLDGVEPLQHPPASPLKGQLKDPGLAALLKTLAARNLGLCLVTTRLSIADLRNYRQTTAPEVELPCLPAEEGMRLLVRLGVKGSRMELRQLVEDVRGHALTLNLLGSYLREAHAGDIRRRDRVRLEEADREEQNGHAFRAMDAYVEWFETNDDPNSRPALALLRLLGLFDRPADAGCLAVLLRPPIIPGLTDEVAGLDEARRNILITRLGDAKLLSFPCDGAGTLLALDAHPLLREYFAAQLRGDLPDAWRAAHERLFRHLCETTEDQAEPSLEDLQPLYQAVAHGCWAGLQQEACNEVYYARILRRDEHYSSRKLGAFGAELGAVACFFDEPWSRVSPALTEADQAWLLNEAAVRLRGLGRLAEALEPVRVATKWAVSKDDWLHAAVGASNLSELELTLGAVAEAVADAERSVDHADRSGNAFRKMATRTILADTLHQAGQGGAAATQFQAAEAMQAEDQPGYPLLYSVQGFQCCDLLLAAAERSAWRAFLGSTGVQPVNSEPEARAPFAAAERASEALQIVLNGSRNLLDIALNHLTPARAALYAACLNPSTDLPPSVRTETEAAADGLRRAGTMHVLPLGLLTRAWLRRLEGALTGPDSAQADLDEAFEIAERGPMPLYLADIHLHRARLYGIPGSGPYPWQSPAADLAEARRLIEKHGYGRRREELEDAEAALLGRRS